MSNESNELCLFIGSLSALPVHVDLPEVISVENDLNMLAHTSRSSIIDSLAIITLADLACSRMTIVTPSGNQFHASLAHFRPTEFLMLKSFQCMACVIPDPENYKTFFAFLDFCQGSGSEFDAYQKAPLGVLGIEYRAQAMEIESYLDWEKVQSSKTMEKLTKDPVCSLLQSLDASSSEKQKVFITTPHMVNKPTHTDVYKYLIMSLHLF